MASSSPPRSPDRGRFADGSAGLLAANGGRRPRRAQGRGARGFARRLRPALLRALPQQRAGYLPRKADDDCLQELRWIYDRRELAEARADLAAWLRKWSLRYDRLTSWVEENIEETFTYYRLPRQHHRHMKSTNMLERLNEKIKRRTHVVRIFPNAESCLRLVRALAVEAHENWLEASRYLNMDDLKERRKLQLREAA
jgi:transposase-like protein